MTPQRMIPPDNAARASLPSKTTMSNNRGTKPQPKRAEEDRQDKKHQAPRHNLYIGTKPPPGKPQKQKKQNQTKTTQNTKPQKSKMRIK